MSELLAAVDAMRVEVDIELMFTFVTETLGEPWDLDHWLVTSDDYIQDRKGDYEFGDPWPLEKTRFLAADRQARGGEHYFWVCRAFAVGGASRQVGCERCNTTSELEEVRKQLNVPRINAMIDTGFKASKLYRFCLATHWKAMKGDDAEHFLSQDPRTRETVRRLWRRVLVDPNLGAKRPRAYRELPLFQWSNPGIKDHLALFTHGLIGQWTVPKSTGRALLPNDGGSPRGTAGFKQAHQNALSPKAPRVPLLGLRVDDRLRGDHHAAPEGDAGGGKRKRLTSDIQSLRRYIRSRAGKYWRQKQNASMVCIGNGFQNPFKVKKLPWSDPAPRTGEPR